MQFENDPRTSSEAPSADEARWLLNAIVENIPNMVFVKDADTLSFTLFNRAGEELLGTPREALIGRNDYDCFPESEADFFQEKDRETLADGLVDIPKEPLQTPTGVRWLHTRKVPIFDDEGKPRYLLGISEDITEQLAADQELRRANERAETSIQELEAFSYSVAHDLRAPLRRINGLGQIVLEDCGTKIGAEARQHLEAIRSEAVRVTELVEDLLMLSRVTSGAMDRRPTDLSALAGECGERVAAAEPDRKLDIVVAPGLSADVDPRLLAVVFDNLLGNAVKFTRGCQRAEIEVGCEDTADGPVYFVRDNGVGFDGDRADELFVAFHRLHTPSDFEGTGIGLATVERIVRRHGGRAWAESKPGEGTTIRFTLPPLPG